MRNGLLIGPILATALSLMVLNISLVATNVHPAGPFQILIKADGTIDPPTAPIQKNGDLYTLTEDVISDSGDGIVIERNNMTLDGAGHTIQGIDDIYTKGIGLRPGSNSVTIKNVKVKAFDDGVFIWASSSICVIESSMMNNVDGITIKDSSNNSIIENNITGNKWIGLVLESSQNNRIYHNNFNNPRRQAVVSSGCVSIWDDGYPSGGNHWSNYNGTDLFRGLHQNVTGNDGIGDTTYAIDANNQDNFPLIQPWAPPDIAVAGLFPYKTVAYRGFALDVGVAVQNEGNIIQNFSLTVLSNTSIIQTVHITLAGKESAGFIFAWNTTTLVEYQRYVINANVEPVTGELNLADNSKASDIITVTHVGDANADGKVDIEDVARVSAAFGSLRVDDTKDLRYGQYWHPTPCAYCPHTSNADINGDSKVDVRDVSMTSASFGWHR